MISCEHYPEHSIVLNFTKQQTCLTAISIIYHHMSQQNQPQTRDQVTSGANTTANFGFRPLAAIQYGTLIQHSLFLVPTSLPKMSVPVHFIPVTISVKTTENPPKHWMDFSKCSNSHPKAKLSHPIFNVLHDAIQFFPLITIFFFKPPQFPMGSTVNYLFHFWNRVLPSPHKEGYTLKTVTTLHSSTVKYTHDSGQSLEVLQIFTKLFSDTDMQSP